MPSKLKDGTNVPGIASMILSAQVSGRGSSIPELANNPVMLMFQFDAVENASNYSCAFWMFSDP